MAKSRKSKKRKTEEEVYVVELITKARVVTPDTDDEDTSHKNTKSSKGKGKQKAPKAKWEYFVKWAGYTSDADSWEPEENVASCTRLLQSFWDHVGTDNNDYLPGYEVSAKESWIKKERAFFVKEFDDEVTKSKGSDKGKSKTKKRKTSPSGDPKQPSKEKKLSIKEESSDDDRPLALSLPPRATASRRQTKMGKRKRPIVESDGDSDEADKSNNVAPAPLLAPAAPKKSDAHVPAVAEAPAQAQSPLFSASSSPSPPPAVQKSPPSTALPKVPPAPTSKASAVKPPAIKLPPPKPPIPKSSSQPKPPPLPSRATQTKPLPSRSKVDLHDAVTSKFLSHTPTTSVPTPSTNGIHTKQRVAIHALDPVNPKEVFSRPAQMPTRTASDTYQSLSFKKVTAPPPPSNSAPQPDDGVADFIPLEPPANNLVDKTPIASPVVNVPRIASGSFSYIPPAQQPKDDSMTRQVDAFLQEVIDPLMAGPLAPQTETSSEYVPRPLHKTIAMAGERTPTQRYRWEGDLALNSLSNVVCRVKLAEVCSATGLSLKIAMAAVDTLLVSDAFGLMDIYSMLPIFRPPTHVGALVPHSTADHTSFRVVYKYCYKHLKAFLVPIMMDGAIAGQLLFCPMEYLKALLNVGTPSQNSEIFGCAVLPYALSPKQKQLSAFSTTSLDVPPYAPLDNKIFPRWNATLKKAPLFHLGLRILQFPHELFQWLSAPKDRSCAIFPAVPLSPEQELQTRLLVSVVKQTPTPLVDIRADARLIFIHNSASPVLYTLPHLVERKLRTNPWPVHFYTYGSTTSSGVLPPVEEIYPCGGVVTFTALAIYRNPLEVAHRIEQISKHPLWTCYLAPEVLGVLAKILFGKTDPFAELEKPHFPLDPILRRIEDGDIAFIYAPPDDASQNSEWLKRSLSSSPPSKVKALEMAVHDYLALYKGVATHRDMLKKLEQHMEADMIKMQRQRALMSNYRRYVVMTADNESNGARQGVEWVHVRRFDFKDMFFAQQDVGKP